MELSSSGQAPPSQTRLRSEEDYTETSQSSSLWLELTVPQHDSSVRLTVDGNSVAECRTQKTLCCNQKQRRWQQKTRQSHWTVTTHQHTDTDVNIFWYKQDGTSRPQFILSRFTFGQGKTEDEFKERFSSTLNPTMKSVPLKIQELQLSDSAVYYYCALRPTLEWADRKNVNFDLAIWEDNGEQGLYQHPMGLEEEDEVIQAEELDWTV
ncbi:hypothetical protein D4764_0167720 [Takifugu flavidus]|uniref:Immunoglobulin V-set domain-containing protein n=1 Tax=Takifugu flavidus TaxID=433684 RepID=A0A5C6MLA6_9TELE|nr:hypothetical protein D4764_0167720 [Takifugu flavidus]